MEELIRQPIFRADGDIVKAVKERYAFTEAHRNLPRTKGMIDYRRLGHVGFAGGVARLAELGGATATFLVDRMLHPDPERRATAAEVAAYFASVLPPGRADSAARDVVVKVLADPRHARPKALREAIPRTYAKLFVAGTSGASAREAGRLADAEDASRGGPLPRR